MPIKWRGKFGRRGRLRTTLADFTGEIAGAFSSAATFSGRIDGLIYDFTGR